MIGNSLINGQGYAYRARRPLKNPRCKRTNRLLSGYEGRETFCQETACRFSGEKLQFELRQNLFGTADGKSQQR